MNKKIVTIQDISCYGQCSITVALPILSSYGFETAILPSAILSTHTSGFKNFTVHDLSDEIPKIINLLLLISYSPLTTPLTKLKISFIRIKQQNTKTNNW